MAGAAVVIALGLIFLMQGKGGSSLPAGSDAFSIASPEQVFSMTIHSIKQGKTVSSVELNRQGENWRLNGDDYALAPKVGRTLDAMVKQRIRQPITEAGQKRVNELLKNHRLEVVLKDSLGTSIKTFDIGVQTQDSKGTVMRLKDDATAYVVAIPGVSGYLNTYFVPDPKEWRENLIFNIEADNIENINIHTEEGKVGILRKTEGWKCTVNGQVKDVDQAKLQAYLAMFNGKLYAETFAVENFPTMTDSLTKRSPDMQLEVKTTDGTEHTLELFYRPENKNNYFGFVKGSDELRTVQTFVIDKYMRKPADW